MRGGGSQNVWFSVFPDDDELGCNPQLDCGFRVSTDFIFFSVGVVSGEVPHPLLVVSGVSTSCMLLAIDKAPARSDAMALRGVF